MTPDEFAYWGEKLPYCRADYNNSGLNERAVEIPIAQAFIAKQHPDAAGLEVGQVLTHYQPTSWTVVDRYEKGADHNIDVFDHHHHADWIVSISTLEHVRWDEPGGRTADGPQRALAHLHSLLQPSGRMLVTVPFGWHPFLDSAILDGRLPIEPTRQCTIVRAAKTDPIRWVQTDELDHHRYAASSIWAESVWVGEFAA